MAQVTLPIPALTRQDSSASEPRSCCRLGLGQLVLSAATFSAGYACGLSSTTLNASFVPSLSTIKLPDICPPCVQQPCSPCDQVAVPCPASQTSAAPAATGHIGISFDLRTTSATTTPGITSSMPLAATSEAIIVKVFAGGNGRLGNNIGQLLHGLAFALRMHADLVNLVASGGQLPQIFVLKNLTMSLPGAGEGPRNIPKECMQAAIGSRMKKEPNTYAGGFWTTRCDKVPAKEYHELALQYIWPLLKPEVKACLEGPDEAPGTEQQLTVHLRGNDLWNMGEFELMPKKPVNMEAGAHHWLWANPPCTMYEKIIREEGFTQVLIVTSPDRRHACVPWFENFRERTGLNVKITLQTNSLAEDFCTLARARNLVLSFSTLSNAAAIMSKRVKRVYLRQFALNSMMNCDIWPDLSMVQYSMPISEQHHEPFNNTYAGVTEWFQTYNMSLITRSPSCK
ncbi:hypothetical protein AK812_SmicGene1429 [Symbiodinium microadriaticum]|uniref:Uncharacterized protein n=1 Tax=Symbiodinium microadriaticum TaxID=2951 RepID=A0A1Q9F496_SYMMI|nr:hypothetical protein AK812_SmicGene1429 [Symbiodinium microadriaticum]CAE7483716.1 unnamed protein product [Symbiodinium microadriaticum]